MRVGQMPPSAAKPTGDTVTIKEIAVQYDLSMRDARAVVRRARSIAAERDKAASDVACRLLIEVCRCVLDPGRGRPTLPEDDLTRSWLEALARKHGLLPALCWVLDVSKGKKGLAKSVSPAENALVELSEIIAAASDTHLTIVPVKGPTLAFRLYDGPELRPFADLDLLIDPSEFEKADRLLRGLGYVQEPGLLHADFYLKNHIHIGYELPGATKVELHWGLSHRFRPWRISVDEVLARAEMRELGGRNIPSLSDEDHLIYLCTHLEEHGYYSRYADEVSDEAIVANPDVNNRLIWLLDIAMMLERLRNQLDWDAIFERACRWGVGGHMRSALRLSDRLLGVGAPEEFIEAFPTLKSYRFERCIARFVATSSLRPVYSRLSSWAYRIALSRLFRMHPTLQFRPSRVFDLVRHIFSEENNRADRCSTSWRRCRVLGAPLRALRLMRMAASILWYYMRRSIG